MKIVIDIDEETYKARQHWVATQKIRVDQVDIAIANGTPLPKGHGRIGDLDELIQTMKKRNDDNGGEPLNAVDRGYDLAYQHIVKEAEKCVIIEADSEVKE